MAYSTSASISSATWNAASCVPATCTAPTAGRACSSRSSCAIRARSCESISGADAAFAMPGVYECLEAERVKYAIRLPANQVLQNRIAYLLKRPVGRPPNEVRRYYANFTYQAASWTKPRRVIAKVEWHPGELIPCVGFHRHQHEPSRRACRRLLQQARHLRAVDQGRQGSDHSLLRTITASARPPLRLGSTSPQSVVGSDRLKMRSVSQSSNDAVAEHI